MVLDAPSVFGRSGGIRAILSVVAENYVLHPADRPAASPPFPCIACPDGYAWHPEEQKRRCFHGVTAAPVELVARVVQPEARPIERVWSLRQILDAHPGVVAVLWPSPCSACGGSHAQDAGNWRRAARALHPGALDALREADPPLRLLLDLDVVRRRKASRRCTPGLPVRESEDATELAQISWASEIQARTRSTPRRRFRMPEAFLDRAPGVPS